MDIASFGIASVACITVICYLAATAVKQTPLANKWLPSICGALGGLLGVAAMYINVPDFPAADPLTALAVGIVSGLAATGAHIRQLRLEQGYSVQDLQTYLGLEHPQAIYHWQHGRNLPSVDNLYALSKLWGVPMDKIIVEQAA